MRHLAKQAGFSLMELLVSVTTVSVLTLAVGTFLVNATLSWTRNNTETRIQQTNSQVTTILRQEITRSLAILTSSTIGGTTYTTDSVTMVLAVPALNVAGSPIYADSTKSYVCRNEVVFFQNGGFTYKKTLVNTATGCNAAAGNAATDGTALLIGDWSVAPINDGVTWSFTYKLNGSSCNDYPTCKTVDVALTRTLSQFGKSYSLTTNTSAATGNLTTQYVYYYFDGSDAAATQPNGAPFTNPTYAVDSGWSFPTSTSATGSTSTNYILAEGTNAPSSSQRIIISVEAAHWCGSGTCNGAIYTNLLGQLLGTAVSPSGGTAYPGNYTALSTPTGGWTWQKINDLETKIYGTVACNCMPGHLGLRVKVI